jgi:muramoyltetrapeptide carboxypeptidase LdcA involved in peptidoglycan recycling
MTMSTADIPVLHSLEFAHVYPHAMIPIFHGVMKPIHLYQGGEAG